MWFAFRPYVSVAQRRAKALREIEKRKKKGQTVTPIVIEGWAPGSLSMVEPGNNGFGAGFGT